MPPACLNYSHPGEALLLKINTRLHSINRLDVAQLMTYQTKGKILWVLLSLHGRLLAREFQPGPVEQNQVRLLSLESWNLSPQTAFKAQAFQFTVLKKSPPQRKENKVASFRDYFQCFKKNKQKKTSFFFFFEPQISVPQNQIL